LDLEPRYDTLMRDVIHGLMGMWLASSVMQVTRQRGWVDFAGAFSRPLFDTESARRHDVAVPSKPASEASMDSPCVGLIPLVISQFGDYIALLNTEINNYHIINCLYTRMQCMIAYLSCECNQTQTYQTQVYIYLQAKIHLIFKHFRRDGWTIFSCLQEKETSSVQMTPAHHFDYCECTWYSLVAGGDYDCCIAM